MLRNILLLLAITVGTSSVSAAGSTPCADMGCVILTLDNLQARVDLLTRSVDEGIAAVNKLQESEAADHAAIKALQAQVANLTERLNMQAVHPTHP